MLDEDASAAEVVVTFAPGGIEQNGTAGA